MKSIVKKQIVKSMDELITIFPTMTVRQIMELYLDILKNINAINAKLGACPLSPNTSDLFDSLSPCLEARDFLGNFLAQCFCDLSGYDVP